MKFLFSYRNLILLTATLSLHAETESTLPKNESNFVLMESPPYSFMTTFQGLAMIPSTNNLNYAIEANPAQYGERFTNYSPSWYVEKIDPSFSFGFLLEIAAFFKDSHTNATLGWQRVHTTQSQLEFDVSNPTEMVGPYFQSGPYMQLFSSTLGKTYFHFDEIHLEGKLNSKWGEKTCINLLAGISYVRILQSLYQDFSNAAARKESWAMVQEVLRRSISCPSKFLGMGPSFGLDFSYNFLKVVHIVGAAKAALYLGNFFNKSNLFTQSETLRNLNIDMPNQQKIDASHYLGVVPAFLGKLGLAAEFQSKNRFKLSLEAGFQSQIYINAIRSVNISEEINVITDGVGLGATKATTSEGFFPSAFSRLISDFSLSGPYGKIDIGF